MENLKSNPRKQKQLPQNFTQKLKQLIQNIPNNKAEWLNESSFKIIQSQQSNKEIKQIFDMGFKTFIKFLRMIGCKVKQIKKDEENSSMFLTYKVTLPTQTKQELQYNAIKQLLKQTNMRDEHHQNFQQISIQMNIHRPQLELFNLEHENELKDQFLKLFKQNIDNTNKFVDESIYRILVGKQIARMSPCEMFQILTELRDRLFDNQRQIQEFIENFQQKIRSFHDSTYESIQPEDTPKTKNKWSNQDGKESKQYQMSSEKNNENL